MKSLPLILFSCLSLSSERSSAEEARVLEGFKKPFLFSYLSFENKVGHENGVVSVDAPNAKGGAGSNVSLDLSDIGDWSPVLEIKVGAGNRAKAVVVLLKDGGKGEAKFQYELKPGWEGDLLPRDSSSFKMGTLNLAGIRQVQVMGDWSDGAVEIEIDAVKAFPPTEEIKKARQEMAKKSAEAEARKAGEEQRKRGEVAKILARKASHPGDGAKVVHLGVVAGDVLGVELEDRTVKRLPPEPYLAEEGDEVVPKGGEMLAWENGKPAMVPGGYVLKRKGKEYARLDPHQTKVLRHEISGTALELGVIDEPGAYRISKNGGEAVEPKAVWRKSKVGRFAQGSGDFSGVHFLYFQLSEPIEEGAKYEVIFRSLNTRVESKTLDFQSKEVRSESLHVSHLGYRASDPFKRAYLSLWTGTGGGVDFEEGMFHLIDQAGKVKFDGRIVLGVSKDQDEPFRERKNHSQTNVYHLDFPEFREEGEFRVWVPGLGVSYPFAIGEGTWEGAFKTSMKGLLHHRSGIALGPPFTNYVRPRPFHPEDGMKIYRTEAQLWDGESEAIKESFKEALGSGMSVSGMKEMPMAWGGYQDAGDWDRRSQHLIVSLRLLELYEMFPKYFKGVGLALPEDEAKNETADVLDEVLWNAWLYRRLQEEDGGVGGGVESTAHPRGGEVSWEESLLVGSYRPDPQTTFRYAATAARLARLLNQDDGWAGSAKRAWTWAEANADKQLQEAKDRGAKNANREGKNLWAMKVMAAIELFRLTGDADFHRVVREQWESAEGDPDVMTAYRLMAAEKADPVLWKSAEARVVTVADQALGFQSDNGFNLAIANHQYLPMIGYLAMWSTPGSAQAPVLPRAHFFTGEEKYLKALIGATQYPGGANPMNMSYTTGIGPIRRQPREPLHLDSWWSGQEAPEGITVYGQGDPVITAKSGDFAHRWFLNRFGGVDSRKWPTAEAYADLAIWPEMTEYTVHQTFSPTGYCWGYLAARK